MSWAYDAPTGVYKNHALSANIRREAVEDTLFMRFTRPEQGYGKGKGESVTITRILQLPLATTVSETERLPVGRPVVETKSISVNEWGFAIEMNVFERNLTHFDIQNQFQMMLKDQLSLTMDKMVADAYKTTPLKYVTSSASAGALESIAGGTAPTGNATHNLGIGHLREIRDFLAGTYKVPTYKGGKYVGILSTQAARGIKNDSEYKDWQSPTSSAPLMDGRMRDVEGFALFETNHYNALLNTHSDRANLGEAIFFGADSVVLAEILTPEIRAGLKEDLGRSQQVGWVGEIQAGLVWEAAATARAIHLTSNA